LVSNIPIFSARHSANQTRSWSSILPRRGRDLGVGVGKSVSFPVAASILPTFSPPKSMKKMLFLESA